MSAAFSIPHNPQNPWVVHETYADGGAKTYRHTGTGEVLTKARYRNLKAQGFDNTEAFSEPPELDASPEVELPPPPPLRDWQRMGGASGGDTKEVSFFGKVGPGIFNVVRGGAKILLNRTGHELAADYIPPADLVKPVLTPVFRIIDRHNPIKIDVSGSADIADLLQAIAGAEKLIDYWSERAAEHRAMEEEYYGDDDGADDGDGNEPAEQRADAPYTGQPDRTPSGRERSKSRSPGSRAKQAVKSLATWRSSTQADRGNGGEQRRSADGHDGGDAANTAANGSRRGGAGAGIDPARAASMVAELRAADAFGRLKSGLG